MAGQQPMLSFAKVVSGQDLQSNNNCTNSVAVNSQQQNTHSSSTVNAQNGNNNDINKRVRNKSGNFKNKTDNRSEPGRRQNQRSGRNRRSGGGPKNSRSVVTTEFTENNETQESSVSLPPPVVVLAPAPLPAVNPWFKQSKKGLNCFFIFLLN